MSPLLRLLGAAVACGALLWLCLAALRALVARISPRPDHLGVRDGVLAPCPPHANCVSTQSEDSRHTIAPIAYESSAQQARDALLDIIRVMPRSKIIAVEANYIYVEFRSAGLRHIDDVEFTIDESERMIHFRATARLPFCDFRVNRKRMDAVRRRFYGGA